MIDPRGGNGGAAGPRHPVGLDTLLAAIPERELLGPLPATVRGLTDDSRRVTPGSCFVAVRGLRVDGRRFIPQAVERGARAVVAEPPDPCPGQAVGRILVPDTRRALPRLADAYFGHPSRALIVVGVTGTNGKTTTAYLCEALLRARGLATGLVGTIQYVVRGHAREASQTTPEALELQALLAEMVAAGVGGVAMEVSSHALELRRVDGVAFDVAVFTNLTQDHLDFHGTMERYAAAKGRLFRELLPAGGKPCPTAVLNGDDPVGAALAAEPGIRALTFGLAPERAIHPLRFQSDLEGIRLEAVTPAGPVRIASRLIGEHNVMNLLGAVGVGVALGLAPERIAAALGEVAAVPGRFERVEAGQDFLVVVDYAHTPDALRRVLETARRLTPGRLGVVFGAGGDRDRAKRPLMGRIAATLADRVWLTSDNPRSEDPRAIIAEIAAGVVPPPRDGYTSDPDRREAIRAALAWARRGDTVVVAGKGHETYQIVAGQVLPFDDRVVARECLSARPGGRASGTCPG
ncbi:MAG TPA: UDP-N-acetylmuramoyl-L-alanyl-D-glutamate--2,6-diaminopimelate ligase [Methylomirabilota bacterium]|nr:UDP-N-acetylmuramoyl-L-alanyl-D-glutamate--2,6-diaminopimelate ligase [Methylomirabilota bacterium]